MSEVRIPTQKRSVEKRNRIIEKGFELMCNNGYYNTNTTQIAHYASVSTGIIYQYFNDKKDIFMEGVKNYSDKILYPMLGVFDDRNINIDNVDEIVSSLIDKFIETHTISKKAHEELMAMAHLDLEIADIFHHYELKMTEYIVSILSKNNIIIKNSSEKVHIAIGIVDNLCHEIVYHKHENIDYNIMKDEVVKIIVSLIKG